MQRHYHSIKALEVRPTQDKKKKRAASTSSKTSEKRDFELPETQTGFSMADLFVVYRTLIRGENSQKSFVFKQGDFSLSVSHF